MRPTLSVEHTRLRWLLVVNRGGNGRLKSSSFVADTGVNSVSTDIPPRAVLQYF